jgi:23S rRNA (uracil1939-C5)-methyltransferase
MPVETIIRLAARGDGVTESGRFFPMAAPGDLVAADGTLTPGPHHQSPRCRHFPDCGGCQLQHIDDAAYADFLKDRIAAALAAQGLATPEILEPQLSPPRSRRRTSLKASAGSIGFNAEGTHRIVDMRECHVLRPELFALVAPLRRLLNGRAGVTMTLADQGVDLMLEGVSVEGLAATEAMIAFAHEQKLARLALDDGYGAQTLWEPEPVTVTLAGVPVALPHGAFLQATAEGETALVAAVREAVGPALVTADLFAGLGTFALALTGKVYAAEGAREGVLALKAAGRGIFADHRDLFRRPLDEAELARFEAVVLDPPRAGAKEQAPLLARSSVPRIAYVSCNPNTFARDAKILVEGGYRLLWVKPVGQFLWSTHVELAGAFAKP